MSMSWDNEFGSDFEVPGFISFLVKKKIVEDLSWHNDVSPSFGVYLESNERMVRLWVDHPFKSQRETEGYHFVVTDGAASSENDFELETDDLEKALEALFKQLAALHKGRSAGVLEWRPEMSRDEWDDPSDYLDELKKEYLEDQRA